MRRAPLARGLTSPCVAAPLRAHELRPPHGAQNPFYEVWDPKRPATTAVFQLSKDFLRYTK